MASDVALIAATMAATPFLQAVGTHFGNRLAGAVDAGAREVLRRFLRRQAEEHRDEPTGFVHVIHLRTEHGSQIDMTVNTSPGALALLPAVCDADDPVGEADRRPQVPVVIR
ncbi:hypothetical protein AB0M05_46890 [Streptomyces violaceusniger]|uniref:hypothetical protein n=1 Tax=Streptomyces violaceusniger TaxID=68280 RepID=UPI003426E1AF